MKASKPFLRRLLPALPLSVTLAASASAFAQAPAPSPTPATTFPAGIELVTVDAVVLDKKGDPVEGLAASEFEIEEDGKPQAISSFEAVALPESATAASPTRSRISTNIPKAESAVRRTFVIVFDNAHMAPERIGVARKAVADFVSTALRPGDEITVVPTSGGAWWTAEMPEAQTDVAAALERLQALRPRVTSPDRVSDWEAQQLYLHRDKRVMASVARRYYEHRLLLEPPGGAERADLQTDQGLPLIQAKAAEVYNAALARKRVTLALLERVARSLAPVKGRKSIILVSEGFVYESELPEFRDVARATREANAAIYFLDARGLAGGPVTADAEIAEQTDPHDMNAIINEQVVEAQGADSIALDSGGFSIKGVNDMAAGLRRIARESRSYYLIGYRPERPATDGKFHKIAVRVKRPGLDVRARRGYYGPGQRAARSEAGTLDPKLRQALDSPYQGEGIPLRMAAHVLGASAPGKANVVLVAEADPAALGFERRGERFNDIIESYVVVSARDTGENVHREKTIELSLPAEAKAQLEASWVPVVREFDLAPGVYQARLLLRDRQNGRVGTVRHEFTVPPLGEFRTSTPILTDTLHPGPAGSHEPRPLPVARRSFAPGRTLYYVFEVFGAKPAPGGAPRVTAGFEIRRADGTSLAQQPAGPVAPGPAGDLSQVFPFSLKGVPAGDYEVVLHVQDEVAGKSLEVRDPFTVAGS